MNTSLLRLAALLLTTFAACKPTTPPVPGVPPKQEVKLLFAGDMSTARGIADSINAGGAGDPRWIFSGLGGLLDGYDMVFANLECAVSDSTAEEATQKAFRIRAPVAMGNRFKEAGIDVVSVANNHAMDFGHQGFKSTLSVMAGQGIHVVGAVKKQGSQEVEVIDVAGHRVGLLAYNQHGDEYKHDDWSPASANYKREAMLADVKRARSKVDFLVVSVHGGPELSHEPAPWQVSDARAAIDAGADAWIGHHPHVVQTWEEYKGKLIFHSLGDFVFDKKAPWLFYRNRARLYVEMTLRKTPTGSERIGYRLITGDQEKDYRPVVKANAFDVEALRFKAPDTRSLSATVDTLRVVRRRDGADVPCDRWEKRRQKAPAMDLRWLEPRWACVPAADEAREPFLTVAATSEMFAGTFRRGVWAPADPKGPLILQRDVDVPRVEGYVGITDWGVQDAEGKDRKPVSVVVRLKRGGGVVGEKTLAVPFERGVVTFDLDASSSGTTPAVLEVEVAATSDGKPALVVLDAAVKP